MALLETVCVCVRAALQLLPCRLLEVKETTGPDNQKMFVLDLSSSSAHLDIEQWERMWVVVPYRFAVLPLYC